MVRGHLPDLVRSTTRLHWSYHLKVTGLCCLRRRDGDYHINRFWHAILIPEGDGHNLNQRVWITDQIYEMKKSV